MANKAKRVRTGCLTCRERHLKCDEAVPDCVNCRRSSRICKRGLRLNFLDTTVHTPSCLALSREWAVNFLDESRHIASEYRGGLKRYAAFGSQHDYAGHQEQSRVMLQRPEAESGVCPQSPATPGKASTVDELQGVQQSFTGLTASAYRRKLGDTAQAWHGAEIRIWVDSQSLQGPVQNEYSLRRASDARCSLGVVLTQREREFIETREELDYMQAFVDGVGVWMDSLDHEKHFSRVIPGHALESPLLLNAILACGAKHLSLANPKLDRKAERYYNTATLHLIRSLQNRDRDASQCTAASVILYVYEVMSDKPARDMNHIAGARALIRECGWDARSTGVGSACFWLSVGMEVLCCLAMNWLTTWDPDEWGLGMDWTDDGDDKDHDGDGDTELGQEAWVHRAFYIVAKVANFRASTPLFIDSDPHDQQARLGARLAEWRELKRLCDKWNNRCPRSMHPVGYVHLQASRWESSFPKFWLTRNSALLGRLLYHTAQCILTQTNPMESSQLSGEMKALQLHHARQVLGIVGSSRDRRMLSVAVQAATIAAATLVDRREQMEAWNLLGSIQSQHGGHTNHVELKLMREWKWDKAEPPVRPAAGRGGADYSQAQAVVVSSGEAWTWPTQPASLSPAESLLGHQEAPADLDMNPLNCASFDHAGRPYKKWYRPAGA